MEGLRKSRNIAALEGGMIENYIIPRCGKNYSLG
jgi:hypothetical protein